MRRRRRRSFKTRRRSGRFRKIGFYGRYNKPFRTRNQRDELKFNDRQISGGAIGTNLQDIAPDLCRIGTGTGEQNRIGRKIIIKSIQLRLHLMINDPTAPVHDIVRVILLVDKQANGAIPTETNILATAGNVGSFYQLENSGRFIILMDETFTMTTGGGAGNGTTNVFADVNIYIKRYFKLHIPIEYSGVIGAITEIQSNNLMLMAMTHLNQATIGDEGITRIRYYG